MSIANQVLRYEENKLNRSRRRKDYKIFQQHQKQRYQEWALNYILQTVSIADNTDYSIKWVGYVQNSHIYAVLYCILEISKESRQNYIRMKYSMYQMASSYLMENDQQLLVQLLSSAEYTHSISIFLNKNYKLEQIFSKMFSKFINLKSINKDNKNIQQIITFMKTQFPFLTVQLFVNQSEQFRNCSIVSLKLTQTKIYLIQYHNCYFIAEKSHQSTSKITPIAINRTPFKTTSPSSKQQVQQAHNPQNIYQNRSIGKIYDTFGKSNKNQTTPQFQTVNTNKNHKRNEKGKSKLFDVSVNDFQEGEVNKCKRKKKRKENYLSVLSTVHIEELIKKMKEKRNKEKKNKKKRISALYTSIRSNSIEDMMSPPKSQENSNIIYSPIYSQNISTRETLNSIHHIPTQMHSPHSQKRVNKVNFTYISKN